MDKHSYIEKLLDIRHIYSHYNLILIDLIHYIKLLKLNCIIILMELISGVHNTHMNNLVIQILMINIHLMYHLIIHYLVILSEILYKLNSLINILNNSNYNMILINWFLWDYYYLVMYSQAKKSFLISSQKNMGYSH